MKWQISYKKINLPKLMRSLPIPDRPAGQESGGMKQKLGLCSALIHDPDLLILDEPTTGVDPLARAQFWALINKSRQPQPGRPDTCFRLDFSGAIL